MRQHMRHTVGATVFKIIVNGMVITAGKRKRSEQGIGHRARGQVKALSKLEVFKKSLRAHLVFNHYSLAMGCHLHLVRT
jgi:hypothetical protein